LKDMGKDDAIRIDNRTDDTGVENWEFEGGEIDENDSSVYNNVQIKSRHGKYLTFSLKMKKVGWSWKTVTELTLTSIKPVFPWTIYCGDVTPQ